jgi:hypothetical protein
MVRQVLILVGLIAWGTARAEDFEGVRPLGMGGAHRAIVTGNDAIELNPAGMSLFKRYSLEALYFFTPKYGDENGPKEHVIHASIVDSQIQAVATGLAYTRVERNGEKTGNRFDLAFSLPISDNVLIGTNVKYINFNLGSKEDAVDAVSVDIGALVRTDFGLNLGVVGYNLTNPADYVEHPMSMAAALMYSPFRTLEIAFDWFIDFQKPKDFSLPNAEKETAYRYHFGVEYLMAGQITLRAGYQIDPIQPQKDEQYWTAGIGYVSTAAALDFGYRGSIHHTWGGTFGFGLRMFM